MLEQVFKNLSQRYSNETVKINLLWDEIVHHYAQEHRRYHNLTHLEHLCHQIEAEEKRAQNFDVLLFTLFYHDIIYDVSNNSNEADSALVAENRLHLLNVPSNLIQKVKSQILATKSHDTNNDADTNLFLDMDLSILGTSWESYQKYAHKIRVEYQIYPDIIYYPAREKVLKHFLKMESIFKTEYYKMHFEEQARKNLQQEINEINKSVVRHK